MTKTFPKVTETLPFCGLVLRSGIMLLGAAELYFRIFELPCDGFLFFMVPLIGPTSTKTLEMMF